MQDKDAHINLSGPTHSLNHVHAEALCIGFTKEYERISKLANILFLVGRITTGKEKKVVLPLCL